MKYNYGGENHKIPITDFNFLHASCIIRIRCHYGRRISAVCAHEKDMNRASQSPFSHVIRKAASVNAHCKQNTVLPGLFQHVDFCTGLSKLEFMIMFLKIVGLIHFWLNCSDIGIFGQREYCYSLPIIFSLLSIYL